jgi:hypothetical protein
VTQFQLGSLLAPHAALQLPVTVSTLPGFGPLYCQHLQVPFAMPQTELAVCPRQTPTLKPQQVLLGEHAPALPVNAAQAACAWFWLCDPDWLQS